MTPSVATFWAPKAGSTTDEWEDAFCCDPDQGRFSVADGASESSFASVWARLLAEGFVARPTDGAALRDWLRPLQKDWTLAMHDRPLPWYAEEKARAGAFSSLLGLCLDADAHRFRALAMGDSCLFVVRAGRLVSSFPLSRACEFHNRPALLCSGGANVWSAIRECEGTLAPGDLILLMTDALAAWFLAETELRRRPWALLQRAITQGDFEHLLELMRIGRAIRNDDVTLVRIDFTATAPVPA